MLSEVFYTMVRYISFLKIAFVDSFILVQSFCLLPPEGTSGLRMVRRRVCSLSDLALPEWLSFLLPAKSFASFSSFSLII